MPVTGAAGAVAGAVARAAGHVIGGIVGVGLAAVFDAASQWVASGAVWLLGQVGHAMSATTTVDLSSGWFRAHESVMATLAAAVILPMVCCAAIQALYRQSAAMLARAFLVQLPLALLLTGVAVELVQMAMAVTDSLSAQLMAGAGVDTTNILSPVSGFLVESGLAAPGVPAFVVFVGGLLVAVAALGLWLELVVRAAAVSVATLFLPLALAALVWPALSHWCRRLADTLAALVLSKLVIAAVLSLAVGAVAGGLGVGATGGDGGGFAAVVSGIALLVIATLSPFTLLRLIPAVEAGAVSHLESARHRLTATAQAPLRARNLALDIARDARPAIGGTDPAGARVGSAISSLPVLAGTALTPAVAAAFGVAGVSGAASTSQTSGRDGDHGRRRGTDAEATPGRATNTTTAPRPQEGRGGVDSS